MTEDISLSPAATAEEEKKVEEPTVVFFFSGSISGITGITYTLVLK